jgi:hypothetical protein
MNLATLAAWLLTLATGTSAWLALNPVRGPGWRAAALGCGSVFGMLLAAGATCLVARAHTVHALAHAGPWLALCAAATSMLAWRRMRHRPARSALYNGAKIKKWIMGLLLLAFASLAWRGWIALREILLRPTYPWDAWDAWAVKSKTWVLLGHYVPFVAISDWMQHPAQELYTSIAWGYPATLAWLQVWFASAAGGWIEPLVNLPWFALWIGLLLGHYGQWRALRFTRTQALAGVYALGSLPLLDVHVALAGYADLWVATVFGFAVLAWLRWLQQRDRAQLMIAIVCALLLPLLKLEGAVWLLLFALTAIYGLLPRRWRKRAFVALLGVLALLVVAGGLKLPVPGLGWVAIGRHSLDVPVIGHLSIAWHGAAFASVLNSLFVQPNWHLLWWLAPVIVAWRWRELRAQESARRLGCLLLAGIAFLLFLFVFTDAASWAESYTAINRLLMHIVPALITFLMLLLREVKWGRGFPRTTPLPVPRSDPA